MDTVTENSLAYPAWDEIVSGRIETLYIILVCSAHLTDLKFFSPGWESRYNHPLNIKYKLFIMKVAGNEGHVLQINSRKFVTF